MIWLASFPRSGNTFFRNVLFEVYGIESSAYPKPIKRKVQKDLESFQVVKTHLLPSQLPEHLQSKKAVYIVRDGRDSLVSIAHHRKDIVELGSDYKENLRLAILAQEGSYFGGWSENVRQWTESGALVIHFEDLIKDPIGEVEKLRSIMDLPEPDISKLPTFEKLKFGSPKYGGNGKKPERRDIAKKHFRKGIVGGWKEDMPPEMLSLFWQKNREIMEANGYGSDETSSNALEESVNFVKVFSTKLRAKLKSFYKR